MSVIQLVDNILQVMGKTDLEPKILNQASHEIREQYLDCTKARSLLDWKPVRSFEEGLGETIDWYRNWLQGAQG